MQMAHGPEEDQATCFPVTEFKAAEAMRGIEGRTPWDPHVFLSKACSSLLRPPGLCPLTQASLGSCSALPLLLLLINTPHLGSKSSKSCSSRTSYEQRKTYDALMDDTRQTLLFGKHPLRPSYVPNTVFVVTRPRYAGIRRANRSQLFSQNVFMLNLRLTSEAWGSRTRGAPAVFGGPQPWTPCRPAAVITTHLFI